METCHEKAENCAIRFPVWYGELGSCTVIISICVILFIFPVKSLCVLPWRCMYVDSGQWFWSLIAEKYIFLLVFPKLHTAVLDTLFQTIPRTVYSMCLDMEMISSFFVWCQAFDCRYLTNYSFRKAGKHFSKNALFLFSKSLGTWNCESGSVTSACLWRV